MKTAKRIILMTLAAVFAISAFGCSCSFSTAKIEDAIMTETLDPDGVPGEEVVSFTADAPVLYTSAKLRNAPDHTQIRIAWTYVTGDMFIDEITLDSGTISDRYISSDFTPGTLLPEGDYKVEYFIEDREEPDAIVKFVVLPEANQVAMAANGAYLEEVSMTSAVDANGYPVDKIDTVAPTGTWYVGAILRNATADTLIHYVWYDTKGTVIDEYDFDAGGETDIYIFGNLVLNQIAPEGQYMVEIYIDGADAPAAQVSFAVAAYSASATDANAYTRYSQSDGWFSILYPNSWKAEEYPEDKAVAFYPADYYNAAQYDVNIVYAVALPGYAVNETLDSAMNAWISDAEAEGMDDYLLVDQGSNTVNGVDMKYYEYSWSRDGNDLYTTDFMFASGNDLFVITFTSTSRDIDTLFPFVREMVLSFEVS